MSLIKLLNHLVLVMGSLLMIAMPTASALSQSDYNSIINHTPFYDANGSFCSSTNYSTLLVNVTDPSVWNSGLTAPYILEQFAIETLKDIAKKAGVPETSVVTQEHVIALLAFIWGEGGDIKNKNLFNPLNSGIDLPALIVGGEGGHDIYGNQSFISFDAGVEATTQTILGSYQSRLTAVLVSPNSTAEEFMYALTYYGNYDGNKEWAAASTANPDLYYKKHIDLVQQVRGDYQNVAGVIIGTPAWEAITNSLDTSKLTYHPTSVVSDGSNCKYNSIVSAAIGMAWPDFTGKSRGKTMSNATQAYQLNMPLYNNSPGVEAWSDCGVFVATVMIASGVDTNYPHIYTPAQLNYILANPDKYQVFTNITNTSQLQPGDIFINSQHTYIYVGKQSNGYNSMAASQNDFVPQANNAYFASDNGEKFTIVRLR